MSGPEGDPLPGSAALDPQRLSALCAGCSLAREIVVLEEITSTSDVVLAAARGGAAEGLVVLAEAQTAGRGRMGRTWESAPRKGLWMSLLLRPRFQSERFSRLTTWAALAVAEAVEAVAPCRVAIKWPNDLQIGAKKIAGILIESGADRERAEFAVLGIGVNVNHDADDFPTELAAAGSLRQAVNAGIDRTALAAAILRGLDASYASLESGFAAMIASAEARSSLIGRKIQVRAGTEFIEGIAVGLDEYGALMLQKSDGSTFRAASGEVTVVASS